MSMEYYAGQIIRDEGAASQLHQGYLLESRLGSGGQANVFSAFDLSGASPEDAEVAIKLFDPFKDPEDQAAFEHEGSLTLKWRHKNILPT